MCILGLKLTYCAESYPMEISLVIFGIPKNCILLQVFLENSPQCMLSCLPLAAVLKIVSLLDLAMRAQSNFNLRLSEGISAQNWSQPCSSIVGLGSHSVRIVYTAPAVCHVIRLVINTTLGYGITASGEIGTLWARQYITIL